MTLRNLETVGKDADHVAAGFICEMCTFGCWMKGDADILQQSDNETK